MQKNGLTRTCTKVSELPTIGNADPSGAGLWVWLMYVFSIPAPVTACWSGAEGGTPTASSMWTEIWESERGRVPCGSIRPGLFLDF